jgi:hypothetical protein
MLKRAGGTHRGEGKCNGDVEVEAGRPDEARNGNESTSSSVSRANGRNPLRRSTISGPLVQLARSMHNGPLLGRV